MKTTELFAELLVIGIGGLAVIAALVLIAAPEAATWSFDHAALLFPGLAGSYVLGIVIDRFADRIFTGLFGTGSWLATTSEEVADYRAAVERAVRASPLTMELYTYGRTRQRICRSWTLIAMGLAAAIPVAAERLGHSTRVAVTASGGFAALALCCFLAWRWLKLAEQREIRRLAGEDATLASTSDEEVVG